MMGDQIYMDEDKPDIFEDHFDSDSSARRKAMAEKYRLNWSRDVVRRILANVPTYMVWDDHDIRDGWGSLASDSPTMAALHARGAEIFRKSTAFFEDARDVYWHFQGCRNPLPGDYRDRTFPAQPDPSFPNYIGRADSAWPAPRDAVRVPLRAADGARPRQPRRARRVPRKLSDPRRAPVDVHRRGVCAAPGGCRRARDRHRNAGRIAGSGWADTAVDGRFAPTMSKRSSAATRRSCFTRSPATTRANSSRQSSARISPAAPASSATPATSRSPISTRRAISGRTGFRDASSRICSPKRSRRAL